MSHFIKLLENALKSGNTADPVFREGVYKGALRAFDKMSDQRPDRAEFRKLHGPQLVEAISRVEQKYVMFDEDENTEFHSDASGPLKSTSSDQLNPKFDVGDNSGAEPPTAEFEDDFFLNEKDRAIKSRSKGQISNKLMILLVGGMFVIFLGLLVWLFL